MDRCRIKRLIVNYYLCRGLGVFPSNKNRSYCRRQNQVTFMERVPLSYACYGTFNKGMEGKGYSKRAAFLFGVLRS